MKPLDYNIRAAVIGGSEDGKTFYTSGLSRGLWKFHGFRSLVSDPYKGETNWGPQAMVFGPKQFEDWKKTVQSVKRSQKFAAIWDEGTHTGGRDSDNTELLTAIRHTCPVFIFIGHGYTTMLPLMRGSLTEVHLAVRDPKDADDWSRLMCDSRVMQCTELKKYEFLKKRKHEEPEIRRHSKAEILAGIAP